MKVRDIMTAGARWLTEDTTAAEAAKYLAGDDIGAVPVCDGNGRLLGMATDRDLKRYSVRRLPVIDGTDLVGLVSQADIARAMPGAHVADLVGTISDANRTTDRSRRARCGAVGAPAARRGREAPRHRRGGAQRSSAVPALVADAVAYALSQPPGVEIKELVITAPQESSWP